MGLTIKNLAPIMMAGKTISFSPYNGADHQNSVPIIAFKGIFRNGALGGISNHGAAFFFPHIKVDCSPLYWLRVAKILKFKSETSENKTKILFFHLGAEERSLNPKILPSFLQAVNR